MLNNEEFNNAVVEIATQMLLSGNGGSLLFRWVKRHSIRIQTNADFDVYARNVIRYCERYGWIEEPALLSTLFRRVALNDDGSGRGLTPFAAQMPAIAARIEAQKPDAAEFYRGRAAWSTCHLSMAMPLLNRDATRTAFEDFFNPLARKPQCARVFVANGPPGSGKSFTGLFLRLLVGLYNGAHDVAEADFETLRAARPLTPDVLAVHLAEQMGTPRARAESEVAGLADKELPERWVQNIAIWLAGEANRTGKTWHLLLDNFHLPGVPETTHAFIEQLAAALAGKPLAWDVLDPDEGPPLRLALLGYARKLPDGHLVREEKIGPITRPILEAHFRGYYEYKQLPFDQARVKAVLDRIEPRLPSLLPAPPAPLPPGAAPLIPPAQPRWKMDQLAEVVLRACAALTGGPGNVPVAPGATP